MSNGGTVLVVVAHPDDEVLGCGGTIARLAGEGQRVVVAILGEGVTSRFDDRNAADPGELTTLHAQSRVATGLLGVAEHVQRDLPDNRFDTVPMLEVVKVVEGLVDEYRPAIVYTHHGGDLNVDHTVVHRAVLTATRPMAGHPVREVYACEVLSSSEWSYGRLERPFLPQVFVDINGTLAAKQAAMAAYETEARAFPHPRSPEAIEAAARRWGSVAGCEAAEAFELVRAVR